MWLQAGEIGRMADASGLDEAAFRRAHVRTVADPVEGPERGTPREALADRADGACSLLVGANECSVYEARPEHCRRFPYWDSVLRTPAGFERARATCPGIAVRVPAAPSEAAFARLDAWIVALEAEWSRAPAACPSSDACVRPPEEDADHFVTGLEADWLLARAPTPEHGSPGGCPWRRTADGAPARCDARADKPLTCRTRASTDDPRLRDDRARAVVEGLRTLAAELDWPVSYGTLAEQIASRPRPGREPESG